MIHTGDGWAIGADGSRRWGTLGAAGLLLCTPENTPEWETTQGGQDGAQDPLVLMQHRAWWTNRGGTWALPGGAIDYGESPEQGALRETWEETGVEPDQVQIRGTVVTSSVAVDHVLRREAVLPEEEHLLEPVKAMIERSGDVREALRQNPILNPRNGGRAVFGLGAKFWWEIEDASVRSWSYHTVIGQAEYPLELAPTEESADLRWWPLSKVEELELMPEFAASLPQLRAKLRELGLKN